LTAVLLGSRGDRHGFSTTREWVNGENIPFGRIGHCEKFEPFGERSRASFGPFESTEWYFRKGPSYVGPKW
jgi:hypothetical protein